MIFKQTEKEVQPKEDEEEEEEELWWKDAEFFDFDQQETEIQLTFEEEQIQQKLNKIKKNEINQLIKKFGNNIKHSCLHLFKHLNQ